MAKYQRYAGYGHQAPEPRIPKPTVPPEPRIVTVQDGLPILFEPCESPAVRVVHPTNPKAPSQNMGVTMLYVPPQGTVAFTSRVSVLVMDWTDMGASPPTVTSPTCMALETRRDII